MHHMATTTSQPGFEYKNKKDETPFETFLRYTDEKEKSADQLAKVLGNATSNIKILDIGTGNGEYLGLVLEKTKSLNSAHLTLVEPSSDLAQQLKNRFRSILPTDSVTVINSDLDNFSIDEKFDVVLASHLFYHLPRPTWPEQLAKILSFLKPDGLLIIVLREKDDAYAFKMAFKPLLFSKDFKALTIDDVLDVLPAIGTLDVTKYPAISELKIPIADNLEDTVSIIEFYLNKEWQDISKAIQEDALDFIRHKNGTFKQIDGIATIRKKSPKSAL